MAIKVSDSIRVGQQKPLEDKYFNELVPYTSINQVNTLVLKSERYIGLTVNINGEEYWYKDGIEDENLVLKSIQNSIEVTKLELDNLVSSSQLIKNSIYKISGVNPDLYGGTTIFLTAIDNNKLSTDGYGIFYNPKYDKSIDGFGIVKDYVFWNSVGEQTESGVYNLGDKVIWGGKHWNCISPTLVNTKYIIDKFNLNTAYFEEIPFNETDYKVVYDKIKYDYEHDLIIERNEQNSNIVSFSYESLNKLSNDGLEGLKGDLTKDNFIKNFQWGNVFDYNLQKGIGNNKIKDSLSENINFSGSFQTNITINNSYRSNLTFTNNSYQSNLIFNNSKQFKLIFNNSYQSNLTFTTSYQSYLIFTNNSYQSNLTFTTSYQSFLTFTNNSYQSYLTFTNSNQSYLTFTNNSYQSFLTFKESSFQSYLTFTNNSYQSFLTFTNNSYQDILEFDNSSYQDNLTFNFGVQIYLYFTNSGHQVNIYIESSTQERLNIDNGHQRKIKITNDSYFNGIALINVYQENITYHAWFSDGGGVPLENNQENLVYDGLVYRNDSYLSLGENQDLSTFSIKSTGSLSTDKVLKISNNSNDLLTLNGAGGLGLGVENYGSSKLVIKSEADAVVLSNELLTSTGWTSTGWTGDFTTGFTHTTGNTSILSNNTLNADIVYPTRIEIIILNRTAGSISVSFGGNTRTSITSTQIIAQKNLNNSKLQITPTSDFNGTVKISIKKANSGAYPAAITISNSLGVRTGEIRASLHNSNSFFGILSGGFNAEGRYNSFFGSNSGYQNLLGNGNSFFGFYSGRHNIEGSYNSYFGSESGTNNIGNANSFFGYQSGFKISNGSNLQNSNSSVFIGYDTRANADNEINQIVIGHTAIGNGSNSVTLGNDSITKTILKGNVGIGGITTPGARLDVKAQGALSTNIVFRVRNSADTQNFLVVTGAGEVYNRGAKGNEFNTFFGEYSGINSTGSSNNAFGRSALTSNTTGHSNSAFGNNVLQSNTTGYCNNSFGVQSLISNITGKGNNAFGYNALESNTEGNDNIAIGGVALGSNTTGNDNTAVGSNALQDNTTGNQNVGLGYGALLSNTTGNQNVSLGVEAGRRLNDGDTSYNTISSNSIYLGYDTRSKANNETNQIVIGHSARGDGSNSVVLGNSSITRTRLQGQVIMGSFTSEPTGIEGAIYYNSTDKKHYGFNGTTWNALY